MRETTTNQEVRKAISVSAIPICLCKEGETKCINGQYSWCHDCEWIRDSTKDMICSPNSCDSDKDCPIITPYCISWECRECKEKG